MKAFDEQGVLIESAFDGPAWKSIREALNFAEDSAGAHRTRSPRCKMGHLLLGLMTVSLKSSEDHARLLRRVIKPPAKPEDVIERLRAYVGEDVHEIPYDFHRRFFDEHAAGALETADRIVDEQDAVLWEAPDEAIGLDALWLSVLLRRCADDDEHLAGLLDFTRAVDAFTHALKRDTGDPEATLFLDSRELAPACFSDAVLALLDVARDRAGGMGYDRIHGPHVFLALLERAEGMAPRLIRLQCGLGVGPKDVAERLVHLLSLGPGGRPAAIPLDKDHLANRFRTVLSRALAQTRLYGASAITEGALLWALLEQEQDGPIARCLQSAVSGFSIERMLRDVEEEMETPEGMERPEPFLLSCPDVPVQDLTYRAATEKTWPAVGMDDLIDQVLRGLHKRMCNNVLITGPAGVGKRELVHELGRRIAAGQARFLRRRKLLFVECEGMSPESSRTQLQTILAAVKDRQDLIVCLNHFENAIRYAGPRESHNLPLLRAALALGHLHLIALIEDRYFAELLSQHYAFLEQFTRVEVSEPDVDTACAILKQVWAPQLAALYGAPIEEAAIDKAVRASQEFTMSERLPLKAIKALREACEQVSYPPECDGGAEGSGPADRRRAAAPRRVTEDEVISAIARRTGIAKSTIAGRGNAVDFVAELSRSVAGQESAIRTVADRLRLIKAGAVRPGRPAAVFLFAGLTGTGKTELAKAIARVYSASHKLVRYDMTLFALEHSIQGLFGVPPGYVGYEAGGKLINDLNADPYCVVLFDEAEKAHPSIWQGMLSLFDEGWTVDQRNVRAYGNRAIFILTSNAGQDLIRQAFRPGMPESELDALKQEIQDLLVRYENPQTHARPFSPEFLGRVTDVAVFHPLSLEAIGEIVSMQARALTAEWEGRRRKRLTVDEAVLAKIARESHQANQESRPPYGGMGGRIVALEISRQIELPAVRLMESDEEAYKRSPGIHVFLSKEGKAAGRFTTEEGQPS